MTRRIARYLLYLGAASAVFGLGKVHARWIGNYDFSGSSRFAWSMAYVGLLWVVAYGNGLPDMVGRRALVARALGATLVPTLVISVIQLVLGSALLPRFVVLLVPLLMIPWYIGCTLVGTSSRSPGKSVLAVLGSEEAGALHEDLVQSAEPSSCVVTVLAPEKASSAEVGEGPLVRAAREAHASILVLSRAALDDDDILNQAVGLHALGIRVRTLDRFYDEWLGKLPRHEVGQASLLFDIGEVHRAVYNRLKRVLDAGIGTAGLLVLGLVAPMVAVMNLFGNRGALFYRQPRVGRHGSVFTIYKFRTMRPAPASGQWTESRDPRVTGFGRWLRRTHLDELPQVINILRGDLATVGPRPEQPHYVDELTAVVPFYAVRQLVRPGLTGWAQVNFRYGASELDAVEKLRYDLYYLQHQSLSLDFRILARTIKDVMRATGR